MYTDKDDKETLSERALRLEERNARAATASTMENASKEENTFEISRPAFATSVADLLQQAKSAESVGTGTADDNLDDSYSIVRSTCPSKHRDRKPSRPISFDAVATLTLVST